MKKFLTLSMIVLAINACSAIEESNDPKDPIVQVPDPKVAFDGTYTAEATFSTANITIKNSVFTGTLTASTDTYTFMGDTPKDGAIFKISSQPTSGAATVKYTKIILVGNELKSVAKASFVDTEVLAKALEVSALTVKMATKV